MLIVRATKKLRERIGQPTTRDGDRSTTLRGDWYATALPWRPQVALLVNERTLLPVRVALAPAATMLARTADQIALTLAAYGAHPAIIQAETDHMHDRRIAPTANRSVLGIMNEFAFLANQFRLTPRPNLTNLAAQLASTPCGPLYQRNISPDRELAALLQAINP